jgi:hypothetical protein
MSNETFVGQTGGNLKLRYLEHKRYIRTNSRHSAYCMLTGNQQHLFETIQDAVGRITTAGSPVI